MYLVLTISDTQLQIENFQYNLKCLMIVDVTIKFYKIPHNMDWNA